MLDAVRSLGRRRLEPRALGEDGSLVAHLPYVTALRDDVLMLREGELMASFAVAGLGAATAESALVADLAEALQSVIAQASLDLGFILHRISTRAEPSSSPPLLADPFSFEVDRRWQAALGTMDLRERRSFVTVTLRPPKLLGIAGKLFGAGHRLTRRIERLDEVVAFLAETLSVTRPERLTLADGRWLGLLSALVTGRYEPMPAPASFRPLADLVASSSAAFAGDRFVVPGASTEDLRHGAVFSLKAYPASIHPGIFDTFDLGFDSVVTQSFTPIEQVDALARIRRVTRQMGAADDLASGRVGFGLHHATVAIFARDAAGLDEAAAQTRANMTVYTGQRSYGQDRAKAARNQALAARSELPCRGPEDRLPSRRRRRARCSAAARRRRRRCSARGRPHPASRPRSRATPPRSRHRRRSAPTCRCARHQSREASRPRRGSPRSRRDCGR
ncbi:MAG: hypothetical protein DI556_20920 [Rhodovulum sulfidophilum]|uniref:CagE TrbE VirB component of type IV transporter system central domain-containing protein n=1 Tax=Rhodovulum sulfidophilum TaxID=35806 RepID=A0A2W5PNI1_RHOSU|nr:MAG: hypothetical protein DI556_20920 [Rhodovulum sulfidophilum]